jgi:L-asparaginase / beta-aspartyl-peptidase
MAGWTVLLHGGAKDIRPEDQESNRKGCSAALTAGRVALTRNKSAEEAAEAIIRVLEDDPIFNAGTGSVSRYGKVSMDASMMEGRSLNVGAVAGLEDVPNPITVAAKLLQDKPTLLCGPAAQRYALDSGCAMGKTRLQPETVTGGDTVGCIVQDRSGHFVVASSTGGLSSRVIGAVGDSPLPGCGFYADDMVGAVACSGDGEQITRTLLAGRVIHGLEEGRPVDQVLRSALSQIHRVKGEAGIICVTKAGAWGWIHNSTHFVIGYASEADPAGLVKLQKKQS